MFGRDDRQLTCEWQDDGTPTLDSLGVDAQLSISQAKGIPATHKSPPP